MSVKELGQHYVLAIYPSPRGLAYALFEDSLSLLDWGTLEVRNGGKSERCIEFVNRLLMRYVPDVLVLEDAHEPRNKRSARIRALHRAFAVLARAEAVEVVRYSIDQVDEAFDAAGALSKLQRAQLVSAMIPALSHRLPPIRKPWMAEHPRMPLFEAAALGIAHYFHEHRQNRQTPEDNE